MKRWSTVQDFITNGKLPSSETVAAFEGFASKGDGGASMWLATGATETPSQSPIQRGDNALTDSAGAVFKPQLGAVFYFDGANQWFPSPFGDQGEGLYQFNGTGWNYYEQAGGAVSISTTTGLITNSFNYDVGTALTFAGYSTPGDGGAAQWLKTSDVGTPSQSPALRGDGTLTDANGAVWEIASSIIDVAMMGATEASADNSAPLVAAIQTGKPVRAYKAYTYDFEGTGITFTGLALDIDFGKELQTLKNFGGIDAVNALIVSVNGRIDCDNTRIVNMVKCVNAETINSDNFEIKNARNVSPSVAEQTFVFEVSSGTIDRPLNANFGSVRAVNLITETQDFPNATPMTFLGGYGSSSTHTQKHNINIDSLHAEDFYSVDESDSVTVIGADSDFFRLFTNHTQLNISTLHLKNVGKRFIKTQEQVNCSVANVYSELDSRFDSTNYNGTFEGQDANSGNYSTFTLCDVEIQHLASSDFPSFFNASGLPHEMSIQNLHGNGFSYFINSVNGKLEIRGANTDSFGGSATSCDRIKIQNAVITNFRSLGAIGGMVRDSDISLASGLTLTGFPFDLGELYNVNLNEWDSNIRVARASELVNVNLTYTKGVGVKRPFRPSGAVSKFVGLTITQNGGDTIDSAIESDGATGDLIVRDFRSATVGCGFISTGSYDVVLDNCDGTITGAGVNSLLTATYA